MGYKEYSEMTPAAKDAFANSFKNDPDLVLQFFDSFAAWGLRVRRDILAHELYFLMRHATPPETPPETPRATPNWEAFLEYLMEVDEDFTLAKNMPADLSARMLHFLEEEILRLRRARGLNDPGDPPLPPQF